MSNKYRRISVLMHTSAAKAAVAAMTPAGIGGVSGCCGDGDGWKDGGYLRITTDAREAVSSDDVGGRVCRCRLYEIESVSVSV